MIVFFTYTHDNIQKLVEQETAYIAERRTKVLPDGNSVEMLDELVMDEEYDVLFKRYFLAAHAKVIENIPVAYLKNMPTDLTPVFREFPDFRQDRDSAIWLDMPCTWPLQVKKSVDIKIQEYFVDYICWRWFETKSPQDAATFSLRLDETMQEIKLLLSKRTRPLRRIPSFP